MFKEKLLEYLPLIELLVVFIGPFLAVILSNKFTNKRIKENQILLRKIELLQQLMEYRYDPGSEGFMKALNAILIVFNDNEEIVKSIRQYYQSIQDRNRGDITDNESKKYLLSMLSNIANEMGHGENLTQEDLDNVFVPSAKANEI